MAVTRAPMTSWAPSSAALTLREESAPCGLEASTAPNYPTAGDGAGLLRAVDGDDRDRKGKFLFLRHRQGMLPGARSVRQRAGCTARGQLMPGRLGCRCRPGWVSGTQVPQGRRGGNVEEDPG